MPIPEKVQNYWWMLGMFASFTLASVISALATRYLGTPVVVPPAPITLEVHTDGGVSALKVR